MEAELGALEAAIGHGFANRELLVRALTHRSLANQLAQENGKLENGKQENGKQENGKQENGKPAAEANGDNERLEFLGDAVLNLVVAEALFELHPEWREGELTRVRSQLVSREHLAGAAATLGLGEYLRLSRNEERSGLRRKSTVLSDTLEAVMGALFLDAGLDRVRAFARRAVMGDAVEQLAEQLRSGAALGNYKSALQERLQAARAGSPVYRVKSESGPGHRKRFLVEVRLKSEGAEPGKPLARGSGSTKKLAEQDAARRALDRLAASSAAECIESDEQPDEEEWAGQ